MTRINSISLLICLTFFSFINILAQDHPIPKTLKLGSKAPDFNLKGIDDKMYSLADFENHDVLAIIFSCNHCPTAQAYEDRIIQLVEDYKEKGVGFVMISPNKPEAISLSELGYTDLSDNFEEMKTRAKDKGYNFPYLYDGDSQEASIAYGPVATPHFFVFNKERTLQYVGRLDASEKPGTANSEDARNALDAILKNQQPKLAQTKTFGCSIKWAWKDSWTKQLRKQWAELPVELEDMNMDELKALIQNENGENLRLINIWATWCGPCIMEFPEFIEIDRMYRQRNFEFVSLSMDQPKAKTQALKLLTRWEASNKNYLISNTDKYAVIEAIDPDWSGALPYTALIAPDGKVVWKQEGIIDPLALKRAIVDHPIMGRVY